MASEKPFGALAGLKVIDLTQILAGPFATQMLADHGADVIKIEPPQGEFYRHGMPTRPDDEAGAWPGYFVTVNRNKKSVVVDLRTEEGRELVRELASTADVFVENFRAGVADRLGLSYETLSARNPKLVYATIRGFGDAAGGESPMRDWPAFDIVAQAMGGVMAATGPDAETPLKVGPSVGDLFPGSFCAFGILAAVFHAQKTGRGQQVDVALADSMLAIAERAIHQLSVEGRIAQPEGNHHPGMCPYGAFPAKDGWVTIACPSDDFWAFTCRALDASDLIDHPDYATKALRTQNRLRLQPLFGTVTARFTKQEMAERLGGHVPFGPVLNAAEIIEHPHFAAREMLVSMDYGLAEPITTVGVPIKLSETPGQVAARAPRLGEHTDEVLRGHGLDEARIAALKSAGAVR